MSPHETNNGMPGRPVRSDFARERGLSYGARRFLTLAMLVVMAGGAGYWFMGRSSAPAPGEIPTIKAEGATYKQKPDDPGGVDIPNQDVQVYHEIDGSADAANAKPGVEHLLPPPEEPNAKAVPVTPNAFSETDGQQPAPVEDLKPVADASSQADPILGGPPPPMATTATQPVPVAPVPVPVTAAPAVVAPKPQVVVTPKPAPQSAVVAVAAPVAAPKKVMPVKAAAAGTTAVQLAAVNDENAALSIAKSLQVKYQSVLGNAHLHTVRADLGAKGVFYRIQSQPLSDTDAKSICAMVKAQNGGCLLVHP